MPEQEHTEAVQSETPENKTPGKTESPAETSAETPVRAETQSDELNDGLNPLERRILALERRGFKHQGSKEKAIKALGFTPVAILPDAERHAGRRARARGGSATRGCAARPS